MINFFHILFYQPLLNALILLYNIVPGGSLGIAIILLTILVKILLYPLNQRVTQNQKSLSKIEPRVKEILEKFKNNKQELTKEMTSLYKKSGVNPFLGFILILVQMPILLALYRVFSSINNDGLSGQVYSFVSYPQTINPEFLGINLCAPSFLLAFISGALLFFQARASSIPQNSKQVSMIQKQMMYFLPVFSFLILTRVISAVSLYFIISTIISIIQFKYVGEKRVRNN